MKFLSAICIPLLVLSSNCLGAINYFQPPDDQLSGEIRALNTTRQEGEIIWALLSEQFTSVYEQGDYQQAKTIATQAWRIAKGVYGPQHTNSADSLTKLGIAYQALGDTSEAENTLLAALTILNQGLRLDDPAIAVTLTNLGNVYFEAGEFAKSEYAHQQALQLRRHAFGEVDSSVAQSLYNLGVLYDHQTDFAHAADFYQQAIDIWVVTLGPQHPFIGRALRNLTYNYLAAELFDAASQTQQRTINYIKATRGTYHQEVAKSLIDLGAIYVEQGKYQRASLAYHEALTIVEAILTPEDPQLALLLYTLGNVYHLQARTQLLPVAHTSNQSSDGIQDSKPVGNQQLFTQVLPLYERALAILDHSKGQDFVSTRQLILSELSLLYTELGENGKARAAQLRLSVLNP